MLSRQQDMKNKKWHNKAIRRNFSKIKEVVLFVGGLKCQQPKESYISYASQCAETDDKSSIGPVFPEIGCLFITFMSGAAMCNAVKSFRTTKYLEAKPTLLLLPSVDVPTGAQQDATGPLVVFINRKSGGGQGSQLEQLMKESLNQYQVFLMDKGGAMPGLYAYRKLEQFRVLVCGGDGTVGWVLSHLEAVRQHLTCKNPPIAVLPVGTGNDLARVLRFGGGWDGESVPGILAQLSDAHQVRLDRWKITFDSTAQDQLTSQRKGQPFFLSNAVWFSEIDSDVTKRPSSSIKTENHNVKKPMGVGGLAIASIPYLVQSTRRNASEDLITPVSSSHVVTASPNEVVTDGSVVGTNGDLGRVTIDRAKTLGDNDVSKCDVKSEGWLDQNVENHENFDKVLDANDAKLEETVMKSVVSHLQKLVHQNISDSDDEEAKEQEKNDKRSSLSEELILDWQRKVNQLKWTHGVQLTLDSTVDDMEGEVFEETSYAVDNGLDDHVTELDGGGLSKNGEAEEEEEVISVTSADIQYNPRLDENLNHVKDVSTVNKMKPTLMQETKEADLVKDVMMTNYFGLGIDAELSLAFHLAREEKPEKCKSRFRNKALYFKAGLKKMTGRSVNLNHVVDLEVDGMRTTFPSVGGLIFLNISSWGGGAKPWGSGASKRFTTPDFGDGLLEVLGVGGVPHMSQIYGGLRGGIRIAQGRVITITLRAEVAVQVDGEPWMQTPGKITITSSSQPAIMLKRMKKKSK